MIHIQVIITSHGKDSYSLSLMGDDVAISSFSHDWHHRPGNRSSLTFQGISLEDALELAGKIKTTVEEEQGKTPAEEG